jgi:hypothetical protein
MADTQYAPIAVDEFGSSRPDDFDATWIDSYAAIHKSAKEKYGVYVDIVLQIDGIDEPYTEKTYLDYLGNQAGDKINLAPSKDQKTFAGASEEDLLALVNDEGTLSEDQEHEHTGPYVIGTAKKLRPGAWSQMVESIKRLYPDPNNPEDVSKTVFPPLLDPGTKYRLDFPKGYRFHFMRLPQDANIKRKSKNKEGGDTGGNEFLVLCATQAHGPAEGGTKAGSKASAKPVSGSTPAPAAASTSSSDDLESQVESAVVEVLSEMSDSLPVKRSSINGAVVKKFKGAEMSKALKFLNDASWMSSNERMWTVDDKGMIGLG